MNFSRISVVLSVIFTSLISFSAYAYREFVCVAYDGKYLFHTRGPAEESTLSLAVKYCQRYGSNRANCAQVRPSDCKEIQAPRPIQPGLIDVVDAKTGKEYRIATRRSPVRDSLPDSGAGSGRLSSAQCSALAYTSYVKCLQGAPSSDSATTSFICDAIRESDYRSCMGR